MAKRYKSPAKISRSMRRLFDYKQAYLEDCWNTEIIIDNQTKEIKWKASEYLKLTLKKNIRIVETREFYNPSFKALPFSQKLLKFQSMWNLDQDSYNFFASIHEHVKRNSTKCDHFCKSISSPNCGELTYFLSTHSWPIT